jgi:hypothetical protein
MRDADLASSGPGEISCDGRSAHLERWRDQARRNRGNRRKHGANAWIDELPELRLPALFKRFEKKQEESTGERGRALFL